MNISDFYRRLENLIRKGVICEVDYAKGLCRVQSGDIKTAFLPWVTARAGDDRTWDAPSVGEQCVIFSQSGELAQGIVFLGLYSDVNPSPESNPTIKTRYFSDGAIVSYDVENHALTAILPEGGTVVLDASGGITLNGNTRINGSLHVSRSITSDEDVSTPKDVKAGSISLKTHKHGNVQGGLSDTGAAK